MRHQGRITHWNDEQGFGFILPHAGGESVFLHAKAFPRRAPRPRGQEIVTYELVSDARGRPRAARVAYSVPRGQRTAPPADVSMGYRGALAYAGAVAVALVAGRLPAAAAVLVVLASVAAYACYAIDKSASVGDGWRIRERTLHALALAGGWPGALLAQKRLRHKVRKASFQAAFRVTVGLNCAAMLAWAAGLDDAAARLLAGLLR
ncbi:MAG: DUF1294 domain-containing protein [Burkholderiaceae bacterium]